MGQNPGFKVIRSSQHLQKTLLLAFGITSYYGQILIPLVKVVFEFAVVVTQEFIALS